MRQNRLEEKSKFSLSSLWSQCYLSRYPCRQKTFWGYRRGNLTIYQAPLAPPWTAGRGWISSWFVLPVLTTSRQGRDLPLPLWWRQYHSTCENKISNVSKLQKQEQSTCHFHWQFVEQAPSWWTTRVTTMFESFAWIYLSLLFVSFVNLLSLCVCVMYIVHCFIILLPKKANSLAHSRLSRGGSVIRCERWWMWWWCDDVMHDEMRGPERTKPLINNPCNHHSNYLFYIIIKIYQPPQYPSNFRLSQKFDWHHGNRQQQYSLWHLHWNKQLSRHLPLEASRWK